MIMVRLPLMVTLLNAMSYAFPQLTQFASWDFNKLNATNPMLRHNELLCFTPETVPIPIIYPQEHDCWTALRRMRDDRDFNHRQTYSYWPYPPKLPPGVKIDRRVPIIYEVESCVIQIDLDEKPAVHTLLIRDAYAMAMHVLSECIRKSTAKHVLGGAGAFENGRGVVSIHGSLRRGSMSTL